VPPEGSGDATLRLLAGAGGAGLALGMTGLIRPLNLINEVATNRC